MAQQNVDLAARPQLVKPFQRAGVRHCVVHHQIGQARRPAQRLVALRRPGGVAGQQRPAGVGEDKGADMAGRMPRQRHQDNLPFAARQRVTAIERRQQRGQRHRGKSLHKLQTTLEIRRDQAGNKGALERRETAQPAGLLPAFAGANKIEVAEILQAGDVIRVKVRDDQRLDVAFGVAGFAQLMRQRLGGIEIDRRHAAVKAEYPDCVCC